jgi:hypothetical protein
MALQRVKRGKKEPRSRAQWEAMSRREKERYNTAIKVVHRLRRGDGTESATAVARRFGTTPSTILNYAGSAFDRNGPRGRLRVRRGDRLVRRVSLRTPDGARKVVVTGSRQASEIAKYNTAIDRFRAGDIDALDPFRGQVYDSVELVTDPDAIERAGVLGEPDFEEFYALTASD